MMETHAILTVDNTDGKFPAELWAWHKSGTAAPVLRGKVDANGPLIRLAKILPCGVSDQMDAISPPMREVNHGL